MKRPIFRLVQTILFLLLSTVMLPVLIILHIFDEIKRSSKYVKEIWTTDKWL